MNSSNQNQTVIKQKSLTVNSILNIIKTCCSILFPLITFPYVLRILGPDNIGKVNFAQSFVSYFALIASLGIATYAIRSCAAVRNDEEKLSNLASQFFSINLIMTVIAYFAMAITMIFFRNLDEYRWLIIIESATIILTTLGADWLNLAMEDLKFVTIRSILFQIISLICMFIFVKNIDDYYAFAIISVCSSSGMYLLNIFYRKKYCSVKFTFKIDWKKHILPITFLFVMTLSQVIMNNTDVTMLGLMKGDYEVGLYSTAYKVVRIISQVVQSLALVIIPRLSVYFASKDYEKLNTLLRKVLNFNITLGLACVVGVELLANEIIFIVGGAEYENAVPIIRILILSFMFSLVGGSFLGNAILIPSGQEKYYMIVCIITSVCNVILNAILIPNYGAVGASIATAISGFLIFFFLLFKIDKNIKIKKMFNIFLGPGIGCIIMVLICYLCSFIPNIWIRVSISILSSVLAYLLILLLFKNEFVIQIKNIIKKIVKKRG